MAKLPFAPGIEKTAYELRVLRTKPADFQSPGAASLLQPDSISQCKCCAGSVSRKQMNPAMIFGLITRFPRRLTKTYVA